MRCGLILSSSFLIPSSSASYMGFVVMSAALALMHWTHAQYAMPIQAPCSAPRLGAEPGPPWFTLFPAASGLGWYVRARLRCLSPKHARYVMKAMTKE